MRYKCAKHISTSTNQSNLSSLSEGRNTSPLPADLREPLHEIPCCGPTVKAPSPWKPSRWTDNPLPPGKTLRPHQWTGGPWQSAGIGCLPTSARITTQSCHPYPAFRHTWRTHCPSQEKMWTPSLSAISPISCDKEPELCAHMKHTCASEEPAPPMVQWSKSKPARTGSFAECWSPAFDILNTVECLSGRPAWLVTKVTRGRPLKVFLL